MRAIKTIHFSSVSAFMREADEFVKSWDPRGRERHGAYDMAVVTGGEAHRSFTGAGSWQETLDLGAKGWRKGTDAIRKIRNGMGGVVRGLVRGRAARYRADVAPGLFVDMGRFVTGQPDCWVVKSNERGNSGSPVVRIITNICVSASVSTEQIMMRGAAVVAAVDILEMLKRRVEVYAAVGTSGYIEAPTLDMMVKVKSASQTLDMDAVAFALAHPAFFRRAGFAILVREGNLPGAVQVRDVDSSKMKGTIVTPSLKSSTLPDMSVVLDQVAFICRQAGIVIPPKEMALLASKMPSLDMPRL